MVRLHPCPPVIYHKIKPLGLYLGKISMTITPHLLAGSAVAAAATDNLPIAFFLGFFLHFLLDALPHVDPGTFFEIENNQEMPWPTWIYIFAAIEFIAVCLIIIFLFSRRPDFGVIIAGGIGGIALDIIDNNPFLRFIHQWPFFRELHFLHHKIHYKLPARKWYWGLAPTLIVAGLSLWYLSKF
ncbi:MAG TPA: hypothetical protein VJK26_02420 [Patescibacteria group bacterium]|nr:hypothetical protein [Patescibacteria group bacterium]